LINAPATFLRTGCSTWCPAVYTAHYSGPGWTQAHALLCLCFQDVKPKKTKNNKKGEVADGKKKGKKEPEEKWKWWVQGPVCP
jgi:hypothetical protein